LKTNHLETLAAHLDGAAVGIGVNVSVVALGFMCCDVVGDDGSVTFCEMDFEAENRNVQIRVARFFLVQHSKTGKNIPNNN
jgi:hypothetical protein